MADWTSEYLVDGYVAHQVDGYVTPVVTQDLIDAGGVIAFGTKYYFMRGRDVDCVGLVYRTWVVVDDPDFTASRYTGAKCGASPLAEIVIAGVWTTT